MSAEPLPVELGVGEQLAEAEARASRRRSAGRSATNWVDAQREQDQSRPTMPVAFASQTRSAVETK